MPISAVAMKPRIDRLSTTRPKKPLRSPATNQRRGGKVRMIVRRLDLDFALSCLHPKPVSRGKCAGKKGWRQVVRSLAGCPKILRSHAASRCGFSRRAWRAAASPKNHPLGQLPRGGADAGLLPHAEDRATVLRTKPPPPASTTTPTGGLVAIYRPAGSPGCPHRCGVSSCKITSTLVPSRFGSFAPRNSHWPYASNTVRPSGKRGVTSLYRNARHSASPIGSACGRSAGPLSSPTPK